MTPTSVVERTVADGAKGRSHGAVAEGPAGRRPRPVRFGEAVVLTKLEVFAACQALADADRVLAAAGSDVERAGLAELFSLLERRLVRV
ncbi:MAG: hypothetical protein ACP5P9_11050 [Acidimicrobiales bacterium]